MERDTTTAETEASTVEPMTRAFMSPTISSSANSSAAMGVLNAAESAAAAPTGTRFFTLVGERCSQRPIIEARPAPICTDGPSRPMECPAPMQSTPVMNLPTVVRARMTPS